MNVRLYYATLYLWNLTTNFDETWHEVHPYSHHGSWKVSFDFTHEQKFFINNNILYKRIYEVYIEITDLSIVIYIDVKSQSDLYIDISHTSVN